MIGRMMQTSFVRVIVVKGLKVC